MAVQEILRRAGGFRNAAVLAGTILGSGMFASANAVTVDFDQPAFAQQQGEDIIPFAANSKYVQGFAFKGDLVTETANLSKKAREMYIADGFSDRLPYVDALAEVWKATNKEWDKSGEPSPIVPWENSHIINYLSALRNDPKALSKAIVAIAVLGGQPYGARIQLGHESVVDVPAFTDKTLKEMSIGFNNLAFAGSLDSVVNWIAKADNFKFLEQTASKMESYLADETNRQRVRDKYDLVKQPSASLTLTYWICKNSKFWQPSPLVVALKP